MCDSLFACLFKQRVMILLGNVVILVLAFMVVNLNRLKFQLMMIKK